VLVPNIVGPIEVRVEAVATLATEEETLRPAIVAGLMPTSRTGLRGMPGVNFDDPYPSFLGFIANKVIQLGKAPAVEVAVSLTFLSFARANLGSLTNIGEVLKDDGTARSGVLHDAFREDVITVPAESPLLATQLFQVTCRRLCSFGLEFALEAEAAAVHLCAVTSAEKLSRGGDSGVVQTQIDSNHFLGRSDIGLRN